MTFKGMLLRLAGSVTAVALVFTAAPAVASAGPQAESLYWIRFAAGVQRCLDANLEGTVYTHACQDRNTYQQWDNYTTGKFRHKRTGLCLGAGTSSVSLMSCAVNASDWTTSSTTNKYVMNKSTGLCLDNDGGQSEPVGLRVCRAGTALWTMTRLTD